MGNWSKYTREEREEVAKVTGKLRCVIVDVEEGGQQERQQHDRHLGQAERIPGEGQVLAGR